MSVVSDVSMLIDQVTFQRSKIAELRREIEKQSRYITLLEEALMGGPSDGLRELTEGMQHLSAHFDCPPAEE